jgi:hypothetical protein
MRDQAAVDLFFFFSSNEWIVAAQAISTAVSPYFEASDLEPREREQTLQIPLYMWHPSGDGGVAEFLGFLLLAIDQKRPEALFWSLAMEVVMILTNNYHTNKDQDDKTRSGSPYTPTLRVSFLSAFVYACTRMLLSQDVYCGEHKLLTKRCGARSLMKAIEDAAKSSYGPHSNPRSIDSQLDTAVMAAQKGTGVKLVKRVTDGEEEPSRVNEITPGQWDEQWQWLEQFDRVAKLRHDGSEEQELEELRAMLEEEQVDRLLKELLIEVDALAQAPWREIPRAVNNQHLPLLPLMALLLMLMPLLPLPTLLTLMLPLPLRLPLRLLPLWQQWWKHVWGQWKLWRRPDEQAPLWWMQELRRRRLATVQLAFRQLQELAGLQVEEVGTEEKLLEGLERRLRDWRPQLQALRAQLNSEQ